MKKTIAVGILVLSVLFSPFAARISLAAVGTGAGSLAISKTVLDPKKNTYTHSLGLADTMYHPGDIVTFHVTVSNTGSTNIPEVLVKDTLPSFLSLTSGSGDFDKTTNSLSFLVTDLSPRTTQTFAISAQIANAASLPTNQGIVCTANKVSAKGTNTSVVSDSSSFCIQKAGGSANTTSSNGTGQQVFQPSEATATPSTGPETLPLLGLLGSGLTGIFLRKKAK